VKYVPDVTGRFSQRPHYEPGELDQECEDIITTFMQERYGRLSFPLPTDALTKLIERDADDLDLYADLSAEGAEVQGVTYFLPQQKPRVLIAKELSLQPAREHRLRTTLTHEYGHVRFHNTVWEAFPAQSLFPEQAVAPASKCHRAAIFDGPSSNWMEWQAGYVCGALLMPRGALRKMVLSYLERYQLQPPLLFSSPYGVALIEQIATYFDVSEDAARVRLIKFGYLTAKSGGKIAV
jgi:Zn-dependent peptidase ImmA (M78 family)